MERDDVLRELAKPIAQELLRGGALARMAYTGRDGFPRVIPTGFVWDGERLVMCTAERAPKVAALRERPEVALTIDTPGSHTEPPRMLLVRGVVTVEIVDGVPEEFLAASRKTGEPAEWAAFEQQVRGLYDRMARVVIEPRWAKLIDFETTLPRAVQQIVQQKQPHMLPE